MQQNTTKADDGLDVSEFVATADAHQFEVPRARPANVGQAVASPIFAPANPVLPPASPVPAPHVESDSAWSTGDSAELCYASFGARAGAAVIDFVILQMVSVVLNSILFGFLLSNLNTTTMLMATIGPLLIGGAFAFFYSVWLESSSWQATPGKKIMGLKVVDVYGRRIGIGKSSYRSLAKGLSVLSLGVGYLMPLWSTRKQALHDKAAGCLVVRSG